MRQLPTIAPHFPKAGDLALLPFGLMLSLPFLYSHHRHPIPSFYAEWWAGMLGLLAALCLLSPRYRLNFSLPKIALLPAALAGLVLIQLALHPTTRSDNALLAVLYFLWVILLMGTCNALTAIHGKSRVADSVAFAIAIGALLSALVVMLQFGGASMGTIWVNPSSGRLLGNLSQPNHLALLLWLGIAALIHLQTRQRVSPISAACAIALLVFASLLSGSRALWLYAIGLVVLGFILRRSVSKQESCLPGAALALGLTVVGSVALPLLSGATGASYDAPVGWINPHSDGARGGLWWMAARMGFDHPWLGIGWGNFSSASFAQIDSFRSLAPASLTLVPGEHAHNLALNLLAELGLIAPLLLIALAGNFLWRITRQGIAQSNPLALSLLLLLVLHAQLEYTLWYSYFLGIAAIALALGDPDKFPLPRLRFSMLAIVLFGATATLLLLRHDYTRLEQAMYWRVDASAAAKKPWNTVLKELIELRQQSQFGGYVDLVLVGTMRLDRTALADKLVLCDQAIGFSPADYAVFKCAALLALNQQPSEAMRLFGQALAAYPGKAPEVEQSLAPLVEQFPELGALRDAATAMNLKSATNNSARR